MLTELKQRHAELSRSYEQLMANLQATNGAKMEVERIIAQLEQEASSQRSAEVEVIPPPVKRRGPKPGFKRTAATTEFSEQVNSDTQFSEQLVNTEFANDVVRDDE